MNRNSTRALNQYVSVSRGFTAQVSSAVGNQQYNNEECQFIQSKKNELLISLTKYFAKEIEKSVLETRLTNIKQDVLAKCPSYTSRVGCC